MEKIVEIDLTKKEYLYEKYNKNLVSRELIEYLISVTPKTLKKEKIKIIINNQTKEENVINLIKEGLLKEYNDSLNIHYHNNVIQFIYLLIGIFILFISTFIIESVLKEVILIGGWVFIWALVELEIFTDAHGRHRRLILRKLLKSEIIEK